MPSHTLSKTHCNTFTFCVLQIKMASCPNGDPAFSRLLGNPSPATRQQIFYTICIFARFALYSAVLIGRNQTWVQAVVGITATIAIVNLVPSIKNAGHQWWSKRFQLAMSILIVAACIASYLGAVNAITIPIALYISLAGGIVQSLFTTFC